MEKIVWQKNQEKTRHWKTFVTNRKDKNLTPLIYEEPIQIGKINKDFRR